MAHNQTPVSPVLTQLLNLLADAYAGSRRRYRRYRCTAIEFLKVGISRCLGAVGSGREFLQQHGDLGALDISVDHFFETLKSTRRNGPGCAARLLAAVR